MSEQRLIIIGCVLAAWLMRRSIVTYPLRLLVMMVHELGHAVATVATGGHVRRIRLLQRRAVTETAGGNRLLTLNAGYLASVVLGALLFALSFSDAGRFALEGLGLVLVASGLMLAGGTYTRAVFIVYGSALCVLFGWFIGGPVELSVLRLVAVSSLLYGVLDIASVMRYRGPSKTDAKMLAEISRVPAFIWASVWTVLSLATVAGLILSVPSS